MSTDQFTLTSDGVEATLQANHLGHMLLTFLLVDLINKSDGRVINLSSIWHKKSEYSLDYLKKLQNDLEFNQIKEKWSIEQGVKEYGNSKLGNIYFSQYLSELFQSKNEKVKSFAVHPGYVNSNMPSQLAGRYSKYLTPLFNVYWWFISKTNQVGAQTSLYCCYEDFSKLEGGAFYENCSKSYRVSELTKDKEVRDEYIKWSWKLIDKATKEEYKLNKYD